MRGGDVGRYKGNGGRGWPSTGARKYGGRSGGSRVWGHVEPVDPSPVRDAESSVVVWQPAGASPVWAPRVRGCEVIVQAQGRCAQRHGALLVQFPRVRSWRRRQIQKITPELACPCEVDGLRRHPCEVGGLLRSANGHALITNLGKCQTAMMEAECGDPGSPERGAVLLRCFGHDRIAAAPRTRESPSCEDTRQLGTQRTRTRPSRQCDAAHHIIRSKDSMHDGVVMPSQLHLHRLMAITTRETARAEDTRVASEMDESALRLKKSEKACFAVVSPSSRYVFGSVLGVGIVRKVTNLLIRCSCRHFHMLPVVAHCRGKPHWDGPPKCRKDPVSVLAKIRLDDPPYLVLVQPRAY